MDINHQLGLTLDACESMSSCLALILCHAASCIHGNNIYNDIVSRILRDLTTDSTSVYVYS